MTELEDSMNRIFEKFQCSMTMAFAEFRQHHHGLKKQERTHVQKNEMRETDNKETKVMGNRSLKTLRSGSLQNSEGNTCKFMAIKKAEHQFAPLLPPPEPQSSDLHAAKLLEPKPPDGQNSHRQMTKAGAAELRFTRKQVNRVEPLPPPVKKIPSVVVKTSPPPLLDTDLWIAAMGNQETQSLVALAPSSEPPDGGPLATIPTPPEPPDLDVYMKEGESTNTLLSEPLTLPEPPHCDSHTVVSTAQRRELCKTDVAAMALPPPPEPPDAGQLVATFLRPKPPPPKPPDLSTHATTTRSVSLLSIATVGKFQEKLRAVRRSRRSYMSMKVGEKIDCISGQSSDLMGPNKVKFLG